MIRRFPVTWRHQISVSALIRFVFSEHELHVLPHSPTQFTEQTPSLNWRGAPLDVHVQFHYHNLVLENVGLSRSGSGKTSWLVVILIS